MAPGMLAMAKRGRPRRSERDDVTVKIDRPLKDMAEAIARARGISTAELLTGMLRGPIDRAYLEHMRELERRVRGEK